MSRIRIALKRPHNLALVALCLALLLLSLSIFRDFGIAYDEPVNRRNGGISFNSVIERINQSWGTRLFESDRQIDPFRSNLNEYRDRDYGVAFDLPVFLIERLAGVDDSRQQYLLRHFFTFIAFLVGVVAVYRIALLRFKDWRFALLASLMLVLSPRMFAESFYNNKDIVFMAAFSVAGYTLLRFLARPGAAWAIGHGLATGIAIDIRIMAVMIPAATVCLFVLSLFRDNSALAKKTGFLAAYIISAALFVYLFWPWLWSGASGVSHWAEPFEKFADAFRNMSNFRWGGWIFFDSILYPVGKLPAAYIPTWILITTPILYLGLFLLGAVVILVNVVRNIFRLWGNDDELFDIVFLSFATLPVLAVIFLNSVVYDGWRQLYFVYPWLILVATRGAFTLGGFFRSAPVRGIMLFILGASFLNTVYWMIQAHPYQNLYFNVLAGSKPGDKYEMDYWGLTNMNGLLMLARTDGKEPLTVASLGITAVDQAIDMLPPGTRRRIRVTGDIGQADYVVTNFRAVHPNDRKLFACLHASRADHLSIKIDNIVPYAVYDGPAFRKLMASCR